MAVTMITLRQQALGVFLAEHFHGRRFLKDAKVIAAQLAEENDVAPAALSKILNMPPTTTWGELAAIILAKE
jgi:hypothetical protein